jgi:hypothetical protein
MRARAIAIRLTATAFALLSANSIGSGFAKPAHQTQPQQKSEPAGQKPPTEQTPPLQAEEQETDSNPTLTALKSLKWKYAPQAGNIGNEATITLSPNVAFLGAADTNRFLQITMKPRSLRNRL